MGVSALAGTIAAPWTEKESAPRAGRWPRAIASFAAAAGILAVALPVAFGNGLHGGPGVNPIRVLSSGDLIAPEVSGGTQLSIAGMVPGQSRSATVRVANGGAGTVALSVAPEVLDRPGNGGGRLSEALSLRIESASGSALYSGPIGHMPRLDLGRVAAGAQRALRFTVTLPRGAGNALEGASLSAGFSWAAA
jgi:hypothetical protein